MQTLKMPYILHVAKIIYYKIFEIKKNNPSFSNIDAIDNFMGSNTYEEIRKGIFHDKWFENLKKNNYIDKETNDKIPDETIKLLKIQKDVIFKQLIKFPNLYYTKNNRPLELSKRSFDHLWRMCESYELWCKETKQFELITLKIID